MTDLPPPKWSAPLTDNPDTDRVTASERPGPQITEKDIDDAVAACAFDDHGTGEPCLPADQMRWALRTTLRPGGLVARAVADELDRLAGAASKRGYHLRPHELRESATEWREGKR